MEFGEVVRGRGFKPSDRFDPQKQEVLTSLTRKILHMEERNGIPRDWKMRKILSCQSDFHPELEQRPRRKVFGSSDYFGPSDPTVDEQKSRAREISSSITDEENVSSKGQSMFYKRKKKSVKWVHQGPQNQEYQKEETTSRQQVQGTGNDWVSRNYGYSAPWIQSQPPSPLERHNMWEHKQTPISINQEYVMMPTHQSSSYIEYSSRNYNTAPRGYAIGQPVYHPIYLS